MTIAILCPNGHKLFCPEDQAGRRGKCPHCGATFRVPELEAGITGSNPALTKSVEASESGVMATVASSPPASAKLSASDARSAKSADSAAGKSGGAVVPEIPKPANLIQPYVEGEEPGADEILFLCPNGHKLRGPGSLGGKAGECPECGEQFLVPEEEVEEPAATPQPAELGQFLRGLAGDEDEEGAMDERGASLGELFRTFWAYRAQGAVIELHLGDGKVFIPDGFADQLSRGRQGLFMRKEANGTFTMTLVDWTSIRYVAVRGVKNLPQGVFDTPT